jgi:hypothetical protein
MFEAGRRTLGRRRCVSRPSGAPSTPPGEAGQLEECSPCTWSTAASSSRWIALWTYHHHRAAGVAEATTPSVEAAQDCTKRRVLLGQPAEGFLKVGRHGVQRLGESAQLVAETGLDPVRQIAALYQTGSRTQALDPP